MADDGRALQLANWLLEKGADGFGPFAGAADLARTYIDDVRYADDDERVWALIRWESSKNATTGFVTGVGGLATLPVALPAGFGAAWLVQARLACSIAHIYGYDLRDDRVRTLVLMSILGDTTLKEPVKVAGKTIAQKALQSGIGSISRNTLTKINQAIGFRLITKAGTKGVINLSRFVPVLGGVVGGAFDGAACYAVGRAAQSIFSGAGPAASDARAAVADFIEVTPGDEDASEAASSSHPAAATASATLMPSIAADRMPPA